MVPNIPVIPGSTGAAIQDAARSLRESTLELAKEICEIPAPTNDENRRTAFVAKRMIDFDFHNVMTDEIGNVTGVVPGHSREPRLLLAAHLDTVFSLETDLTVTRDGDRWSGPGIGDNSLGVAAALMIPTLLKTAGCTPETDWLVTGNVGEEGLGNLRGMIAVVDAHPETGAVVALEGHNLGRVTHVAVGSNRYQVNLTGPGGHSWGESENHSAIHEAARLISSLSEIDLPKNPKTTLNVGTFSGGISVNTIAPSASFLVDIRSTDKRSLERLTESVESLLVSGDPEVSVQYDLIGERPAGSVDPGSRITSIAHSILSSIGIEPVGDASSTDANIPISRGIPAICLGLTEGGNVHREDEYIDAEPLDRGLYQMIATGLAISSSLANREQLI